MSTSSADWRAYADDADEIPIEELARRQGVHPIRSVEDLAAPGIFETDEELEEFLAHVAANRRADLA